MFTSTNTSLLQYAKLRCLCKLLCEKKLINDFWVSGHKIKLKTIGDEVKIIGHKDELLKFASEEMITVINSM